MPCATNPDDSAEGSLPSVPDPGLERRASLAQTYPADTGPHQGCDAGHIQCLAGSAARLDQRLASSACLLIPALDLTKEPSDASWILVHLVGSVTNLCTCCQDRDQHGPPCDPECDITDAAFRSVVRVPALAEHIGILYQQLHDSTDTGAVNQNLSCHSYQTSDLRLRITASWASTWAAHFPTAYGGRPTSRLGP
jgi:hypothetical protein